MPLSLIELRGQGLCVHGVNQPFIYSPGFASIAGETPVFGELARQQARLQPRHGFNQFWEQLSLDPLPLKNNYFRHAADIAHRHLDELTRPLALDEVVLAVPGTYSRNQLAVLLGIARQCAFTTVGLVDAALLHAASGELADDSLIIDLQAQHAVLSQVRRAGGELRRERVLRVSPGGLLALQEAWINLIADEFVRQSRFDPQQSAIAEQYIADQLPRWLAQCQAQGEVLLELNLKGSLQQARVSLAQFEQGAQNLFSHLARELEALRGPDTRLYTSASDINLPGFTRYIPGLIALDEEQTLPGCLRYLDQIRRAPDNLQLVTQLSLQASGAVRATAAKMPTHLLFQNHALPLPWGRLSLGEPPPAFTSARILPLPRGGFTGALSLLRSAKGVELEIHGAAPVWLNGQAAQAGQMLKLGDAVQLGHDGPRLQLIVVEGT
ncbi:MAG: hypothetical protein LBE21_02615 [Pseudomonadales bacterium]|jgi:hypothetical protein|nr:hypothetical protein [Pseudomonadales bacterium]